ncbi:hypothetical protein CC78DRAFT_579612 [Lojkania enalia]|uniref:Uncharacterized protein n=1 Tax=Lojkania enalia TaxID=147567 RepID=A0A9P4KB25_9PLEO|nr:hypothetical protein CC78DRAFT_579612 [Didymosphaeria enalia]
MSFLRPKNSESAGRDKSFASHHGGAPTFRDYTPAAFVGFREAPVTLAAPIQQKVSSFSKRDRAKDDYEAAVPFNYPKEKTRDPHRPALDAYENHRSISGTSSLEYCDQPSSTMMGSSFMPLCRRNSTTHFINSPRTTEQAERIERNHFGHSRDSVSSKHIGTSSNSSYEASTTQTSSYRSEYFSYHSSRRYY